MNSDEEKIINSIAKREKLTTVIKTGKVGLDCYINTIKDCKYEKKELPVFPEDELNACIDNTWGDTGKAIFNNWLGLVYGLTSHDRLKQYMDEVDPKNPLGIKI